MSTQPETMEQKTVSESTRWLQQAIKEAQALQTVERILSGLLRGEFQRAPEQYDVTAVKEAMRAFNQGVCDRKFAGIDEIRARLQGELERWRAFISRHDEGIMTYRLRRFCERTDEKLDAAGLAALTRFYRNCPHTDLSQSKYDLAVTRLFAPVNAGNRRDLRVSHEQLADRLKEICAPWVGAPAAHPDHPDTGGAVDKFNSFIAEVGEIKSFEDMIACDLPNRIRAFKRNLGEAFYEPDVTASAIECNIASANKISSLFEQESEHISNAYTVGRELADIFSDTSPDAPDQVTRVLEGLRGANRDEEADAGERLARLARLLRIACADPDSGPVEQARADEEGAAPESADVEAGNGGEPQIFPPIPPQLAQRFENREIIASYMKASPEVRKLDVAAFLTPLSEDPVAAGASDKDPRRNALKLIIDADDMLRSELVAEGAFGSDVEESLSQLLREMQAVGKDLRKLMGEALAKRESADSWLYVSNHLLEAQLRLQSAIVRRSASEFARAEAARAARARASVTKIKARPATKGLPGSRTRKLLIAAAVLVAVVSLALRSAVQQMGVGVEKRDKEVRVLDPNELPGGDLLADARLRRNLMIGIVSDSWKLLGEDEKHKELQALLHYGEDKGINTVMLLDRAGQPVGSASPQQISTERDLSPSR